MSILTQKDIDSIPSSELKALVKRGIFRIMTNTPNGTIPMCIEDTPEFSLFKKLKGKGLGIAEAGRKYNVPTQTMMRWKQRGFIKVLFKQGQKILLDEAYAAYCAYVYHLSPGQGRWVFNKNGTPRVQGVDLRN